VEMLQKKIQSLCNLFFLKIVKSGGVGGSMASSLVYGERALWADCVCHRSKI
jgi:hypothetical protein